MTIARSLAADDLLLDDAALHRIAHERMHRHESAAALKMTAQHSGEGVGEGEGEGEGEEGVGGGGAVEREDGGGVDGGERGDEAEVGFIPGEGNYSLEEGCRTPRADMQDSAGGNMSFASGFDDGTTGNLDIGRASGPWRRLSMFSGSSVHVYAHTKPVTSPSRVDSTGAASNPSSGGSSSNSGLGRHAVDAGFRSASNTPRRILSPALLGGGFAASDLGRRCDSARASANISRTNSAASRHSRVHRHRQSPAASRSPTARCADRSTSSAADASTPPGRATIQDRGRVASHMSTKSHVSMLSHISTRSRMTASESDARPTSPARPRRQLLSAGEFVLQRTMSSADSASARKSKRLETQDSVGSLLGDSMALTAGVGTDAHRNEGLFARGGVWVAAAFATLVFALLLTVTVSVVETTAA